MISQRNRTNRTQGEVAGSANLRRNRFGVGAGAWCGLLMGLCAAVVWTVHVAQAGELEVAAPHVDVATDHQDVSDPDGGDGDGEALPDLWFTVGEELVYRVYWGRIPVGQTVVRTEWVEEDGRPLVAISIRTRSNRVLDRIYPVDDVIESVIDPHTFLPVRFTKNMKEGRYRAHEVTEFDFDTLTAHWRSINREREATFELEPDTRDLVAFSYYMRKEGFNEGERRQYRVMADEKIYDLWLEARTYEPIRLQKYGLVSSIEVEPEAAFEGLFVRKGRVQFWVSDDDRRLMTKMVGRIPVASIRLVLHRVRGPGKDAWILDEEDDDDEDDELDEG